MGGRVPLGYDVRDRKLVVNEAEAATVRRVFEGFAELGSGTKLTQVLRAEGVATKRGKPITKGDVYKLLSSRTYLGEVVHKGKAYPGEHQGIVSRALWDRVHAILREPSDACQHEPEPEPGLAAGPDLRRGRAGDVAHAHAKARTAVSLLRQPERPEGGRSGGGRRRGDHQAGLRGRD